MTAFKGYHMCREHREGSLKIGGVERASLNVWRSIGRDSLEKGKYPANSYTAARVNVYYKLSSFFPMLFWKWNRDINGSWHLLDLFPGIIS